MLLLRAAVITLLVIFAVGCGKDPVQPTAGEEPIPQARASPEQPTAPIPATRPVMVPTPSETAKVTPAEPTPDQLKHEKYLRELLQKLKTSQGPDLEKTAHELFQELYYDRTGTVPPKEVIDALLENWDQKDKAVRKYVREALIFVRDESALPLFIKMLDDPDASVRSIACAGLYHLGPKAKEAAPKLIAKIKDGKVFGLETLVELVGKDALPAVFDELAKGRLDERAVSVVVTIFAKFPDPRAAEFMGGLHDRGSHLVHTHLYFAALADEPALARLRKSLTSPAPDPQDATQYLYSGSAGATLRSIAVAALGRKKDKDSFETILKMLADDPSINVRTAAAVALGEYADAKAVPALLKTFEQDDSRYSSQGHVEGTLRRRAVISLGKIGTDDALAGLYAGTKGGRAQQPCLEFWSNSKDPKHLAAFLKLYDADPQASGFGAGTIESLLRSSGERKLTAEEQIAEEAKFLKTVDDDQRFGPKADLTDGGKWRVKVTYTFLSAEFATAWFNIRDVNPRGFGTGTVCSTERPAGDGNLWAKPAAGWSDRKSMPAIRARRRSLAPSIWATRDLCGDVAHFDGFPAPNHFFSVGVASASKSPVAYWMPAR